MGEEEEIKSNGKVKTETPLMKQYSAIKRKYPDAILLFRVGDFYETFGEDAVKTSRVLDIVLTKRANGSKTEIALAGFPYHALDNYLPKMVDAGYRVAVCDQLEKPSKDKKIVKRGVTEIVTPGVSMNDRVLNSRHNNYLAAIETTDFNSFGISFVDVSTGHFLFSEVDLHSLQSLLHTYQPSEILLKKSQKKDFTGIIDSKFLKYFVEDWLFDLNFCEDKLLKHFDTKSLKGYGIEKNTLGIVAAGVALYYIGENLQNNLPQIQKIERIESETLVWIDTFTYQNLELIYPLHSEGKSLLDILDKTKTPMGARMMKKWIMQPLKKKELIEKRISLVELFLKNNDIYEQIAAYLNKISDIERLAIKIITQRINPHEVNILKNSLIILDEMKSFPLFNKTPLLAEYLRLLEDYKFLIDKIETTIEKDASPILNKGFIIKKGVNEDLDEYRNIIQNSKEILDNILKREIQSTGISSLKINFNNVFGYFFEVRNTYKNQIPPEWKRKQTLVSSERYISPELKELETKILSAEDKISELEERIFRQFVQDIVPHSNKIQQDAKNIAVVDCLLSFAQLSLQWNYCKPEFSDEKEILIENGRHPVIEQILPSEEKYIGNDTTLLTEKKQIAIITGPNMSGKSAYLRQNALCVLMAQMGCFVPATKYKAMCVDRVFSRVGASDNISSGESTFMVEMNETANILNNFSSNSLLLLDEIGRGTSTYDGISIAWSIAEYLHEHPYQPFTFFATHYHELAELEKDFENIHNLTIEVKEIEGKIHFLRKIINGASQKSFGIQVAMLAGIPKTVLDRANDILTDLEIKNEKKSDFKIESQNRKNAVQLKLFEKNDEILEKIKSELKNLELNSMTPMEALLKINAWQKTIK